MPRPRARCVFELGGYWLSTIPERAGFYAFWTDTANGRTCRKSLGTEDIEAAKLKLAEMALHGAPRGANTPLSIVLEDYFTGRTDQLPSAKPARGAGRTLLTEWGETVRVEEITVEKQREFTASLAAKGRSLGYISRILSVLSAALRHAGLDGKVVLSESHMRDVWKIPAKARRKLFMPTDHEMAAILRAKMPENLSRWLLIAMATGCRPGAAIDLRPANRIREAQALDLNPAGRSQNKKFRPVLRLPRVLTTALDRWEKAGLDGFGGCYCGYASVDSVDSALERVCKPLGLGRMSVYSLRHKVTTVLRAAGVPREQIDRQLGHKGSGAPVTDDYGEFSPAFQREATAALDAWVRRLRALKIDAEIARNSHRPKAA